LEKSVNYLPTGVVSRCYVLSRRPPIASNESAWHGALCS
jgi:hypothetical protein